MSGPKTSRYTLTPEQRRILAEQRKIERRKAVASEKIKRDQKKLLQIGGMFSAEKQIASELAARTGNDNGISALIDELDTIIRPINLLVSRTSYDDVTSIEGTAEKIADTLKEAEKIAAKIYEVDVYKRQIICGLEQYVTSLLQCAVLDEIPTMSASRNSLSWMIFSF